MSRELSFGNFAVGRFGWLLEHPILFKEPIPCRGLQGIGTPSPEMQEKIFNSIATQGENDVNS